MMVDHEREWAALVDEAMEIRETARAKRGRLLQIRRDICVADTLNEFDATELIEHLNAAIEFVDNHLHEALAHG